MKIENEKDLQKMQVFFVLSVSINCFLAPPLGELREAVRGFEQKI
jgi:hypothetical protein